MPTIEGKLVNQQGGKYSGYQVLTQFETNVALDGSEPPAGNPS